MAITSPFVRTPSIYYVEVKRDGVSQEYKSCFMNKIINNNQRNHCYARRDEIDMTLKTRRGHLYMYLLSNSIL